MSSYTRKVVAILLGACLCGPVFRGTAEPAQPKVTLLSRETNDKGTTTEWTFAQDPKNPTPLNGTLTQKASISWTRWAWNVITLKCLRSQERTPWYWERRL